MTVRIQATRLLYGDYGWLQQGEQADVNDETGRDLIRAGYARLPQEAKEIVPPEAPSPALSTPAPIAMENKAVVPAQTPVAVPAEDKSAAVSADAQVAVGKRGRG